MSIIAPVFKIMHPELVELSDETLQPEHSQKDEEYYIRLESRLRRLIRDAQEEDTRLGEG